MLSLKLSYYGSRQLFTDLHPEDLDDPYQTTEPQPVFMLITQCSLTTLMASSAYLMHPLISLLTLKECVMAGLLSLE